MPDNEIPAIREATGAFCQSILASILPVLREAARFKGYAVTVHGSLKRDIDLVAVAWTERAVPASELVEVVCGAISGVLGNCIILGGPTEKPHGRIAWTLVHPGFAGEIDLSVVGPAEKIEAA